MSDDKPKPYNLDMNFTDSEIFEDMRQIIDNVEKEKDGEIVIVYKKRTRIRTIGHAKNAFIALSAMHLLKDLKEMEKNDMENNDKLPH